MPIAVRFQKLLPFSILCAALLPNIATAQTIDWTRTYAKASVGTNVGSLVKRDGNGNVIMAGTTSFGGFSQAFVRKYTSDGVLLWSVATDAVNAQEVLTGMAIDGTQNVIVSGWTAAPASSPRWMVLRITAAGGLSWMNSPVVGKANGVAASGSEAVVTGWADSAANGHDIYTVKYNAAGSTVWSARSNGTANGDDDGAAVSLDGSQNVYVAGSVKSSSGETQLRTIKYSSAGARLWLKFFVGPSLRAEASHIAAFQNGGCAVLGRMWDGVDPTTGNLTLTSYSPNGSLNWRKAYNGSGNLNDVPKGLAIDDLATIAIVAETYQSTGFSQMATLNYSTAGAFRWSKRLEDIKGIRPSGVAIDSQESFVVSATVGATDTDLLIVKYLKSGTRTWTHRIDGGSAGMDGANGVVVDPLLNAYIVGSAETTAGSLIEAILIKMH
ncbi:MAG: hypothetical protein ACAH95_16350 [Fimbriimonas sp.]